ncbi:MAG TPA: AAA family ATPase, partial [Candidatus Limnocylindria bacterium]|nr:AAA family ATPase [Candidatus Limnocylindria bacterium]
MQLTQLYLKNFRCFADKTITFESPLVLIEGNNGSGKTSLLEALHYLCYLRSFRTHSPRDLLFFGHETFFIKALCEQSGTVAQNHEIQVGFSHKKRLVKIDQRAVSSYKELMDYYRIVTLTEDDVVLIQGGPDVRR